MRIRHRKSDGWRRAFAFLPIFLPEEVIWLEWVWLRKVGLYTEVFPGKERPQPPYQGVIVANA